MLQVGESFVCLFCFWCSSLDRGVLITSFCHQHAETKGLAPELMEGVMGILKPSGGAGGGDGDGAGGGIDMAAVMGLIGSLTNRWLGFPTLKVVVNATLPQGRRRRRPSRWFHPAVGRRSRRRRRRRRSFKHKQHCQDPPRPRQVLLQCQEWVLPSDTGLGGDSPYFCISALSV